ncbi:MAG: GGDEF domain-containing protein [Brachymonas sp.]
MDRWAQPDRQPSFSLPLRMGRMDLVVQVAHQGVLEMPVALQNSRAFLTERTRGTWSAGMMIGVSLVMMLMGLMLSLNFRHLGFLSVTVMSATMLMVLMFGSGLGGIFMGTDSARFNDEIKFYANTLWSTSLPFVAALALGLRKSSPLIWWSVLVLAVAGLVLGWYWASYELRYTVLAGVPILVIVVLSFTLGIMAWAWCRDISRNWVTLSGLALQILSPLLPLAAYMGWIQTDDAGQSAALVSLVAGIFLLRGLFLQHRMGRQVLARANTSPMRDVLTGLLNRAGMQAHLYKLRSRLNSEQTCAVFIYLQLINEQDAMRLHGEEGFEMGVVQVAASLSSSVTGVDGLARISRNAFAVTMLMPPDPALAIRVSQKILSRLMALSSHGTPLAGTARMSLSWLPLYGFRLDRLEQRSLRSLEMLDSAKRIGCVGGSASHAEAHQLLDDVRSGVGSAVNELVDEPDPMLRPDQEPVSSNLYDRIHRIEREMLNGVDTSFLLAETERMGRMINEANSSLHSNSPSTQSQPPSDDAPTELLPQQPQIKPA